MAGEMTRPGVPISKPSWVTMVCADAPDVAMTSAADATPALIERVEPYCAIEQTSVAASRAGSRFEGTTGTVELAHNLIDHYQKGGVVIDNGLVLTIGYLITEAEEVFEQQMLGRHRHVRRLALDLLRQRADRPGVVVLHLSAPADGQATGCDTRPGLRRLS